MPTFVKSEKLCNTAAIARLFEKGHTIYNNPIKIKWLPVSESNNTGLKVVISVSKHKFKKAVDRNRIKRILRECYRHNKSILEHGLQNKDCNLALIFTGNSLPVKDEIEPIIIRLFYRLIKEYENLTG